MPEAIFKKLPLATQLLACDCDEPHWKSYWAYYAGIEMPYIEDPIERMRKMPPFGMFCLVCLKPHRYSLDSAYTTCEGCESYYVPLIRKDTYPIKHFLCQRCDVPTRNQQRRNRTNQS